MEKREENGRIMRSARGPQFLGVLAATAAAVVSVCAPSIADEVDFHLRCGVETGDYVAEDGTIYLADREWGVHGSPDYGYVDGDVVSGFDRDIAGTDDPTLFHKIRRDFLAYRIELPAGLYLVTLKVTERFLHGVSERQLDIVLEGELVDSNLDLLAIIEKDHAIELRYAVSVTDGVLDIEIVGSPDNGVLAAIDVIDAQSDDQPPTVAVEETIDGFGQSILRFQRPDDPDFLGYNIYRRLEHDTWKLLTPRPTPIDWYLDRNLPAGHFQSYLVTGVDVWGNESTFPAEASTLPLPHGASGLPVHEISVTEASLANLNANPFSDEDQPGALTIESMFWPDCGVRFRGASSRYYAKKSWRVESEGEPIYPSGQDAIYLQAQRRDDSYLRDALAYRIYADAGMPSPSTSWIHVNLNSEFYGVGFDCERMDDVFLEDRGYDNDTQLFKCDDPFQIQEEFKDYNWRFEHKGGPEGHNELIRLIELVATLPQDEWIIAAHELIDLDVAISYYAMTVLLSDCCAHENNYFMLHDGDTRKWHPVAWDKDTAFRIALPLSRGVERPLNFGMEGGGNNFNRLQNAVLLVPQFRNHYCDRLDEYSTTLMTPENLDPQIDAHVAAIEFAARRDTLKRGRADNTRFDDSIPALKEWIIDRAAFVLEETGPFRLDAGACLHINELMATNTNTVEDEEGQFEDWFEILNSDVTDRDLGGMYLSDDPENLLMWQVPEGTIAEAGSPLIFWADDDEDDGPTHVNFKLSAAGDQVILTDTDGVTIIDQIDFAGQIADVSWHRYPDATPNWSATLSPTPGTPNYLAPSGPDLDDIWTDPVSPAEGETIEVFVEAQDPLGITSITLYWWTSEESEQFAVEMTPDDSKTMPYEGIWTCILPGQDDGVTVFYFARAANTASLTTLKPEDAPVQAYSTTVGYVGPALYINEFMADNVTTLPDEDGDYDDWIEIYNGTGSVIDLSGMVLGDEIAEPGDWTFPEGTSIDPDGFIIVWADDDEDQGPLHADFRLSADGDEIVLLDSAFNGFGLIDSIVFGPQETDISAGRSLDGDPTWTTFVIPTPGHSNDPSTCPWDLDGDDGVDIGDLLSIIDQWGKCVCVADFDQDGRVGITDLLAVIDHWGPCPDDG